MSDEQIVKLLEDIRDLHRQQLANAQAALTNQEESMHISRQAIERQQQLSHEAMERQRTALKIVRWVLMLIVPIVLLLFMTLIPSLRWLLSRCFKALL